MKDFILWFVPSIELKEIHPLTGQVFFIREKNFLGLKKVVQKGWYFDADNAKKYPNFPEMYCRYSSPAFYSGLK